MPITDNRPEWLREYDGYGKTAARNHYATFVPGGIYKAKEVTCPVCRRMLAEGQAL
jgi:hypothetical protein